jgi:hypothetical protein
MLAITEHGKKLLWAAMHGQMTKRAGIPVTLATVGSRRKKRKAGQAHRRKLIDQTAEIMRRAEPSVFAMEGFMRHGLRAGLCLRGWAWSDADELAADVVRSALNQIGAKRPTFQQGQPEWTQDGIILIERERCVRCGWNLPENHRKFCSRLCHSAYHSDLHRRFAAEQIEAVYDPAP